MKTRIRADGRKTLKQKPGPKAKNAHEREDWAALVVFHALKASRRLRHYVMKPSDDGYSDRQFACVALAATAAEVEIDRRPGATRLNVMSLRERDQDADPTNIFDALIKAHRKILRGSATKNERRLLEKTASMFCQCAFPHRAAYADHPVLFTPAVIFGPTRAWPLRGSQTKAGRILPSWQKVVDAASEYQRKADEESARLAQKATAELRAARAQTHKLVGVRAGL